MPAAVFLTLMLAQSPPAEPGEAAKLERIRQALAEAPASVVPPPSQRRDGLVFRSTAYGRKLDRPMWEELSVVPSYVRPMAPSYHYQFLHQVTPEAFRQGTLYPTGFINTQMVEFVVRQIKAANRKRQEANAKEEVRQALEELHACRANPARPGCG